MVHGSQRFHAGFSLGAVIAEYGVLRDCMLDLIRSRQVPIRTEELDAILKMLGSAVVSAAEQFEHERDQAIERQSHQHFGFIAHELRNPLSSAMLAAQALQGNPGARDEVIIQRLQRNLSVLHHLIDNTLISVRIHELGRSGVVDRAVLGLREIVESIRSTLRRPTTERCRYPTSRARDASSCCRSLHTGVDEGPRAAKRRCRRRRPGSAARRRHA